MIHDDAGVQLEWLLNVMKVSKGIPSHRHFYSGMS